MKIYDPKAVEKLIEAAEMIIKEYDRQFRAYTGKFPAIPLVYIGELEKMVNHLKFPEGPDKEGGDDNE